MGEGVGQPGGAGAYDQAVWQQRLGELKAFKKEQGHCNVPNGCPANPSLGHWVSRIRTLRKQGKLDQARIDQLDLLGFCWKLRHRRFCTYDWDSMVSALKAFKGRYKHCDVPVNWEENPDLATWLRNVPERWPKNPRLADWVAKLRKLRRDNRLPAIWVERLNKIGFDWGRTTPFWQEMFDELAEYRENHGHSCVPVLSTTHRRLADWVRRQRAARKKGKLSPERIKLLDELGFVWHARGKIEERRSQRADGGGDR